MLTPARVLTVALIAIAALGWLVYLDNPTQSNLKAAVRKTIPLL